MGYKPITNWEDWKSLMWNALEEHIGYPGFSALEQYMYRSRDEIRCVECGESGTVRYDHPMLVPSVSHYYLCDDCEFFYAAKVV